VTCLAGVTVCLLAENSQSTLKPTEWDNKFQKAAYFWHIQAKSGETDRDTAHTGLIKSNLQDFYRKT